MLDGLVEDEMNSFLDEHPTIVPLFEIDVLSAVEPFIANTLDHNASYEPNQTLSKSYNTPVMH